MIIAIDRALPYWKECFADLGEVRPFSGKELRPEDLAGVDALIVRTVTPVNAALLAQSSVRFVGAASAGMDHVDVDHLRQKDIHFCYAAGCNANAVSEYIITLLCLLARKRQWRLTEKSLAVIGVGHVGSRVARKAQALGMRVLLCDPPLYDATGDARYLPFDAVIGADILTFHTPLTPRHYDGPYPTRHLVNRELLARLTPRQFLINASRGAVFDTGALAQSLRDGNIQGAALDVWEGEPDIDYELLSLLDYGTPHTAGTTLDGKISAVTILREKLCAFLGVPAAFSTAAFYPAPQRVCPTAVDSPQAALASVIIPLAAIDADDSALRQLAALPAPERPKAFERLRASHTLRPEFHHYAVDLTGKQRQWDALFRHTGFQLNHMDSQPGDTRPEE